MTPKMKFKTFCRFAWRLAGTWTSGGPFPWSPWRELEAPNEESRAGGGDGVGTWVTEGGFVGEIWSEPVGDGGGEAVERFA